MTDTPQKPNIFLYLGICIILIIVGVFVFKTITNFQERIKGEELKTQEENKEPILEDSSTTVLEEPSTTEEAEISSQDQPIEASIMLALENKSILMVIAYKDFRDEEYFKTRQVLEAAGAQVDVASNQKGTASGADGNTVETDVLIKDVNLGNYDAVVFIGGSGALTYLDNQDSYNLAKATITSNKLLAGICISPVVLAKSGVLEGKKATVWTSPTDKSAVKILEDNGASFNDKSVVADGMIITGNGPEASEEFAMKIIEVLVQ